MQHIIWRYPWGEEVGWGSKIAQWRSEHLWQCCGVDNACVRSYKIKMICHFGFGQTDHAFIHQSQSLESCYIKTSMIFSEMPLSSWDLLRTPPGKSTSTRSIKSLFSGRAGGHITVHNRPLSCYYILYYSHLINRSSSILILSHGGKLEDY